MLSRVRVKYPIGGGVVSSKGGASCRTLGCCVIASCRALGCCGAATCRGVDKRLSGGTHSTIIFQIWEEENQRR